MSVVRFAAAADLPTYRAEHVVSGEIRICASPADRALIEALEAGFVKWQPGITFRGSLHGPESTLAGVYTGVADLAFMAREMRVPLESMAFEWVHHYKAFEVEIANAGFEGAKPGVSLAVFVHKDNPLTRLTLTQLDAILGAEHLRSATNIRKWGDLAIGAAWEDRPIHIYGPQVDSIPALFIRRAVLGDSRKWNPDYQEFASDGSEVLDALARDRDGLAYAPAGIRNGSVKSIELAATDGSPFYSLTPQTVAARTYPLNRVITVVLDREPGRPIDPKVKELLRYVLSRQGQAAVARDGGYIALGAQSARRQLQRLE
jgi:phosphate transport system substrate-binding protein